MSTMNPDFPLTSSMQDAGALLGRLLIGAIFVWAGYTKIFAAAGTIAYFTKLGLPVPTLAYGLTLVVEFGVGLMFVLGLYARPAALVLAVWCIATGIAAHSDFADRAMLVHFYKNVAMAGGLLYAMLFGAGRYSLDAVLRRAR